MTEMINFYTFDYKTYIKEIYGLDKSLITESPALYHQLAYEYDYDVVSNSQMAIKIEKNSEHIGNFDDGHLRFRIYKQKEDEITYYHLLEPDKPILILIHDVREIGDGVESIDIWQSHRMKGLARLWIFNFILKNYKFMMSDKLHTPKGKHFWQSLIEESLSKKLNVFVLNTKTGEKIPLTNLNNFENYYGSDKFYYRFVIKSF